MSRMMRMRMMSRMILLQYDLQSPQIGHR